MSNRGRRSSDRGRYRRMYELTGVPGWIRFGTMQGGRSGRGLGPCAEYLQRIGKFDEFLKDFTAKNPGLSSAYGDFDKNPEYEKTLISDQIRYLEDELKELRASSVEAINISYEIRIKKARAKLKEHKDKYLTPKGLERYSPKFLNILNNVLEEQYIGLHLIYSQFRTLEGIGILSLVLEANGFAEFKIVKVGNDWKIVIPSKAEAFNTMLAISPFELLQPREVLS